MVARWSPQTNLHLDQWEKHLLENGQHLIMPFCLWFVAFGWFHARVFLTLMWLVGCCGPGSDLQSDDVHLGYFDGLLLSAGLPVQPTGWQHVLLWQRRKCELKQQAEEDGAELLFSQYIMKHSEQATVDAHYERCDTLRLSCGSIIDWKQQNYCPQRTSECFCNFQIC